MKELILATGEITLVDDIAYDSVKKYKWHLSSGYPATWILRDGKKIKIRLHKFLTDWTYVDHIDRNKLNNQLENLRESDAVRNGRNSSKAKDNTSGVIGVYWAKANQKWQAQITVNYKIIYLGLFDELAEAKAARRQAEIAYFGEAIQ